MPPLPIQPPDGPTSTSTITPFKKVEERKEAEGGKTGLEEDGDVTSEEEEQEEEALGDKMEEDVSGVPTGPVPKI
jgi:hypothetical protein